MGDPVLLRFHFARGRKARSPSLQVQKVAFLQEMDKVREEAHKNEEDDDDNKGKRNALKHTLGATIQWGSLLNDRVQSIDPSSFPPCLPSIFPSSLLLLGSYLEFLARDGARHGWIGQLLGNALQEHDSRAVEGSVRGGRREGERGTREK